MDDLISRQAAIDALGKRPGLAGKCEWEIAARKQYDDDRAAIESVPSAQPEQKIEELLPDGTLLLSTDADLSKVGRVLVSQNGTHYGGLYYVDAQPEQKTGRWIPVKFRPMDSKEREYWEEQLGEELAYEVMFDCPIPEDGQEILVSYRNWISMDKCERDGVCCGLEGNGDWDGVIAWMPLPKPYERREDG